MIQFTHLGLLLAYFSSVICYDSRIKQQRCSSQYQGKYQEAIEYFDRVLAIDPNNRDASYSKELTERAAASAFAG
jgi:tetratricopeptide (TPR) repeat protein